MAIDYLVDERVENVSCAVLEQLRLTLTARPNVSESALRADASRQDIVGADEDVDFANAEVVVA